MSEGPRILRSDALRLAQRVVEIITPFCDRVEIAGSLRRGRSDVGDIEVVCVPEKAETLFETSERSSFTVRQMLECHYPFIKGGDHQQQYELDLCVLDLYLTSPEQWGVILALRTGPAEFSHKLVTPKRVGGYLPSYLKVKNGRVANRSDDSTYDTPEEIDFFRVIGMMYLPPEERK